MMKRRIKRISIVTVILTSLCSVVYSFNFAFAEPAGSGGGGTVGGGSSGDPSVDCSLTSYGGDKYGRCNLWNRVSINTFKNAWARRIGSGYSSAAYNVCTDPNKNKDGYVVMAGQTYAKGYNAIALYNLYPIPSFFGSTNWKTVWKNHAYDERYHSRRNFFGDSVSGGAGYTYQSLMNAVIAATGLNEDSLAFFCEGMLNFQSNFQLKTVANLTYFPVDPETNTISSTSRTDTKETVKLPNGSTKTVSQSIGDDSEKIFATFDAKTGEPDKRMTIDLQHTIFRTSSSNDKDITVNVPYYVSGTLEAINSTASLAKPPSETIVYKKGPSSSDKYVLTEDDVPLGSYKKDLSQQFKIYNESTFSTSGDWQSGTGDLITNSHFYIYRPYNFDLTPKVSVPTNSPLIVDQKVAITAEIINSENTDPNQEGLHSPTPDDTIVQIYAIKIAPDKSIDDYVSNDFKAETPSFDTVKNDPELVNYLASKLQTATSNIDKIFDSADDGNERIEIGTTTYSGITYSVPKDTEIGTKVCYATVVNYTSSSNSDVSISAGKVGYGTITKQYNISNIECQTTGKTSSFQVWGGSIFGGGNLTASSFTSATTGHTFGSWVDYGITSNGDISNIASAAGLEGGNTDPILTNPAFIKMTIANEEAADEKLGYANIAHSDRTKSQLLARYDYAKNTTLSLNDDNLNVSESSNYTNFTSSLYDETTASDTKYRFTHIEGGKNITSKADLPQGTTHVIYANGNLNISGNFYYTDGPYFNAFSIPQYIIIAEGDITIDAEVTRIDAILISKNGIINTCTQSSDPEPVKRDICLDFPLTIRGAIFANRINLTRSYGEVGADDPAERIIQSAATSFWANKQSEDYSRAVTTYLHKLSPRY